ncbi:cation-translocating P-type ATPase [Mucilaginibacter aquariorum]|uniref:Cation-transporting P-type ATPase n=1 Tax=Mucilaginibacter aquariorum TaxID=2967225 RepID=A0ABT1T2S3_9SPHI|nr:cation-transporting P-type ATPase [Mucilaginibacter aquariorum]MCQ6958768.1 cation-transporting P-type ATPase [Mucilaginibacter aquariorum]
MNYPLIRPFAMQASVVTSQLRTDMENGLTEAESIRRRDQYGLNTYHVQQQKNVWRILLAQFSGPIVYLLIFGAGVSFYFRDMLEGISILVVIIINALIGFLMEIQARSSMKALQKMDIVTARVIRAGRLQKVPAEQLVPGDLVVCEAGDIIPADGRLITVNHFQCDESSLTGESIPCTKSVDALPEQTFIGDQENMVFKGTAVVSGNAKMIVTGIADQTYLGTITSLVATATAMVTPLDKKLNQLSRTLIWITLTMTAIFALTAVLQGKALLTIIETSIALAVAAIPEGLPIVATVALSYGMLLMARRNAIVKHLSAVETLGSTGVILTDKTGTLTENKITLDTLLFPNETVKVVITGHQLEFPEEKLQKDHENFRLLLLTGVLCNNAEASAGDPIEVCLQETAKAANVDMELQHRLYPRVDEIPFSSDIMMMGTLHQTTSGYFVATKGSVEQLLEKCNWLQNGNDIVPLTVPLKQQILTRSEKMSASGLRVLAFAYKAAKQIATTNYLQDLVYIGMAGFLDPPRNDIRGAIIDCRNAGIKVVMITGDHPQTALNIARKVGLIEDHQSQVLTGQELPGTNDLTPAWRERILRTAVFARTTAQQKLQIADVFQQAGMIIAMTGDGVNDAPALKKADVGIAMGVGGTQVAKETAGIVLKDDSFSSIAQAVAHGREIFQNIQKFVVYLVSCNLSEIFMVTIMGIIMPGATLLPLQILFLNMVTDIFPALALGLGTGDRTVMQKPPRDPQRGIIAGRKWFLIALYAGSITLAVICSVLYGRDVLHVNDRACNNLAFITLTFAQLFHVFNMASYGSDLVFNEITRNKWVWLAVLFCGGLMLAVFSVPGLRLVLGLSVLPLRSWFIAILTSLLPLASFQLYRLIHKYMGRSL